MPFDLPSLRFQPKLYRDGVARFHLAFLYDLVAQRKPRRIVTLGFSDAQIHFTFCQAVREFDLNCRCLTIRRETAEDDPQWEEAIAEAEEFYPEISELRSGLTSEIAAQERDGSIDILLVDDCDRGAVLQSELQTWRAKLVPDAVVLFHGTKLERSDSPRRIWKGAEEFSSGIGLGSTVAFSQLLNLPNESKEIENYYETIAARIDAQVRAAKIERENSALRLRQVWFDTVMADRARAQQIMDDQAGQLTVLRAHAQELQQVLDDRARKLEESLSAFDELRRDRAKAQLVIDWQSEKIRDTSALDALRTENEELRTELKARKRILRFAKEACRKGGRCFRLPSEEKEKPRRSIPEKIIRELKRIPANLRRKKEQVAPKKTARAAAKVTIDRYAEWIARHEPDAAALDEQRSLTRGAKLSLLLLIHDPPRVFLDELFASLAAQTYDNFEICAVDAASAKSETTELLQKWQQKEPRLRIESLPQNFGIAENTNRALALATGDFVVCIDHDDVLAPFALYELARAIAQNPNGEIFYSDEDRLSAEGKRHSPFFKPQWNPELLLSFMYLGHLTAYRRDLVERVGKFRKEFDLSQDYDFALRATELAREIVHVPHVLYHWREHPASGSAGGKPDARKTNLAALSDAMKRRGLAAEVIEYPTANRVRLQITDWPRVSIIVPTDSATRAKAWVAELPRITSYRDVEIVIVTNSLLAQALESLTSGRSGIQFVRYDKPFNFSEKCNLGAAAASGSCIIFLNDDVVNLEPDWIQNLIEPLQNPAIGAVSPKLLYENGKIQHAGLVTGVRELVGTVCHQWPGDSTDYFNFAQSMRAASALSAACLAMRREDFFAVGEFDAINTPVAHSDFDLCFKIRAAGMRCVYTPFVTMIHRGHESIGAEEEKKKIARAERAAVFLLKRWPQYTARDPYFTNNMRDWLYHDSPTPLSMFVPNEYKIAPSRNDLLFVSHDLSLSGAPMMLFHAALWCRDQGDFVVIMAPQTGPLAKKIKAAGIPLIIDPLVEAEHDSFRRFAREFHCVIANTVFSAPAVRVLARENVPVAFWLHEPASVGEHYMRENARLRAALPQADVLITPSAWTGAAYQPFNDRPLRVVRNAIPDCEVDPLPNESSKAGLRFLLLGSVEPRKGQDTFLKAIGLLPRELHNTAQFQMAGRILDMNFAREIETAAKTCANLSMLGARDHTQALALLHEADVIVSPSRDEAMPTVTILEAMCLGKAIIATTVGGAQEALRDGENALLVRPEDPAALTGAIERLIKAPALVRQLGAAARQTYEKDFTIDRLGHEFREVIAELIAARAA